MSSWSDTHGPPRKRMRKGTKSCLECRRRKIRCTYITDYPDVCNECRLRGSKCIDQEHNGDDSSIPPGAAQGEQRYSLRERVAHLENLVHGLTKRLDQQSTAASSPAGNSTIANLTPTSVESDRLGPSSVQIQNAPVMQLFDNYLVSRQEDPSSNDQFTGVKDMSPKARAVRAELLSLLPPQKDIWRIINEGSDLYCVWEESFPEIQGILDSKLDSCEGHVAPADVAKALVCLSMSIIQSPESFDFNSLLVPIDPEEFSTRLTTAVDRLVVHDDDFAATLPGIECQMLMAKFHLNEGRLRKAWLVTRRAIEFAHLAGMHLSTRTPRPMDTLFDRRVKVWCMLNCSDRSLSFLLGLPYGVAEAYFLPQVQQRLKTHSSPTEQYLLRIGVICGHMVDRNQNPADMSLESTLKLDSELEITWKSMPRKFVGERTPGEAQEQFYGRTPLQFMPKVLRALLHLPFMLKYPHDPQYAYSHRMAIKSAREALALYKVLRAITRSYLCKMIDFLAFTMGMLLILHLHGYSDESPEHSKEQDESDWRLVGEVVEILGQAREEKGGSVAAESSNILGQIFRTRSQKKEWSDLATCKITVPYFGTITVGAGAKFSRLQNKEHHDGVVSGPSPENLSNNQTPDQLYTPPLSELEGRSCTHSNPVDCHAPVPNTIGAGCCPAQALPGDNLATSTFAGPEINAFTGLFDEFNQFSWPTPNIDLGLDHGWNLNWFD